MAVEIRTPGPEEVRRFLEIGAKTFSEGLRPEDAERDERVLDRERMYAAYDGDAIVGTAADVALTLTVPGGSSPPPASRSSASSRRIDAAGSSAG